MAPKTDFPLACTVMDAFDYAKVRYAGRRLALTIGCDPDDGQQEALLIAVEAIRSSRMPLSEGKLLGRVHDRLLGRWSRLRKAQPLEWQGIYVSTQSIEAVADVA